MKIDGINKSKRWYIDKFGKQLFNLMRLRESATYSELRI